VAGAALLTAAAYQVPCTYRIDVGAADAAYVEGFGAPQRFQQVTWRWTLGDSRLVFHDAGQVVPRGRLRLRFAAPRPEGVPAPTLVLAVNDGPLTRVRVPGEFVEGVWALPPGGVGPGDLVLRLQSATFPKGDRRLGVQVDWAEVESDPGMQRPPLRTVLLALAVVLLLTLWPGTRAGAPRVLGIAGASASAAGLAFFREAAVAVLPPLAMLLAVAMVVARARRGRWLARLEMAVERRQLRGTAGRAGLALAGTGAAVLALSGPSPWAVLCLVAGASSSALFAAGVPRPSASPRTIGAVAAVAAGLLAIALVLRLHALGSIPFSLFRDEARHGLVALEILRDPTYKPVFVPPPVSQPAAYMYLLAWVFERFGVSLASLRVVSALAGAAAVPLLVFVLRPLHGLRVSALAAFGLAASSWHLAISRFAMPYTLPTVMALAAYGLLLRGIEDGRLVPFVGAGLALGLAQYGAQTSRVLPLVAAALVADAWLCRGDGRVATRGRLLAGSFATALVAALTAAPLLRAASLDPDAFLARTREVALWNGETGEGDYLGRLLLWNAARYAGAFHVQGDWNGRHHLPGAPLLDPISGVCAAVGVVAVARALGERRSRFLAYWLAAGLLPGLLSGDAPTALRTVEAAPAVYAIAAIGADRVLGGRAGRIPVVVAIASAVLAYNAWTYFVRMYETPAVWRRGGAVATRLGETLRDLAARGRLGPETPLYVPAAFLESPDDGDVLRFLTEDRGSPRVYDSGPMPPSGPAAFVLPNYADEWRLVAAAEPRYAAEAERAGENEARWRRRLAPLGLGEAIAGPPFPRSDRPTFWLYVRP